MLLINGQSKSSKVHIDEPIINLLKIDIDESMVQNFLFDDHVQGLS